MWWSSIARDKASVARDNRFKGRIDNVKRLRLIRAAKGMTKKDKRFGGGNKVGVKIGEAEAGRRRRR